MATVRMIMGHLGGMCTRAAGQNGAAGKCHGMAQEFAPAHFQRCVGRIIVQGGLHSLSSPAGGVCVTPSIKISISGTASISPRANHAARQAAARVNAGTKRKGRSVEEDRTRRAIPRPPKSVRLTQAVNARATRTQGNSCVTPSHNRHDSVRTRPQARHRPRRHRPHERGWLYSQMTPGQHGKRGTGKQRRRPQRASPPSPTSTLARRKSWRRYTKPIPIVSGWSARDLETIRETHCVNHHTSVTYL